MWAVCYTATASAQLTIDITRGADKPRRIAVSPFSWAGLARSEPLSDIVRKDLTRSGQFDVYPATQMLSLPTVESEISYFEWRKLGVEYLLVGQVRKKDKTHITYILYDITNQRALFKRRREIRHPNAMRQVAHAVSDHVYEVLTGDRGVFSTHLLYILHCAKSRCPDWGYRLVLADVDGANAKTVLESTQPIVSPNWAPDGKKVAYVSFERRRPEIYIQELATGNRHRLPSFAGLNSAPAWSPEGRRMALVLSKGDNPDIYIMNLVSGELLRVAPHFSIDTEPAWTPDGENIIFTSDRGGTPQLYRVNLRSRKITRLTYKGRYNARATIFPDNSGIVFVHRAQKRFHIAMMNWRPKNMLVLTDTVMDESPSISPNGNMLLYATQRGNRGILVSIPVNGGKSTKLVSLKGDVREPRWSPFLR